MYKRQELAKELTRQIGCEVILTRNKDVYLPLEERTAIANKVGADLFISLHANANKSRKAFGIETYYLNFSKNDKAAAVAARENGTSLKQVSDLELILFDPVSLRGRGHCYISCQSGTPGSSEFRLPGDSIH